MSLGVSAPPIHSSRSAYAQLESHSKEDCNHEVQDSFDKHVTLSAMECHSCGFWLVTKPDAFLGLFTVFERNPLIDLEQFCATIL
jgi:hypothetical protein